MTTQRKQQGVYESESINGTMTTVHAVDRWTVYVKINNEKPKLLSNKDTVFGRVNGKYKSLWRVLTGKRQTAYGYKWKYKNKRNETNKQLQFT